VDLGGDRYEVIVRGGGSMVVKPLRAGMIGESWMNEVGSLHVGLLPDHVRAHVHVHVHAMGGHARHVRGRVIVVDVRIWH
jgi:hypothetical protein